MATDCDTLKAILNTSEKDMIRNTNVRLELGVDEIINDIQKSRLMSQVLMT